METAAAEPVAEGGNGDGECYRGGTSGDTRGQYVEWKGKPRQSTCKSAHTFA